MKKELNWLLLKKVANKEYLSEKEIREAEDILAKLNGLLLQRFFSKEATLKLQSTLKTIKVK